MKKRNIMVISGFLGLWLVACMRIPEVSVAHTAEANPEAIYPLEGDSAAAYLAEVKPAEVHPAKGDPKAYPASAEIEAKRSFFNAETSMFRVWDVTEKDGCVSTEFEVWLSETEADFLRIEANKDMEAVLRYSYSTDGNSSVVLGYYSEEEEDRGQLEGSRQGSVRCQWFEEKVPLKKGVNVFYLSGDSCTADMICEIRGTDGGTVICAPD